MPKMTVLLSEAICWICCWI